jgi:hypothetical protein
VVLDFHSDSREFREGIADSSEIGWCRGYRYVDCRQLGQGIVDIQIARLESQIAFRKTPQILPLFYSVGRVKLHACVGLA